MIYNHILNSLLIERLSSSDPVLRVRALQTICDHHFSFNSTTESYLINTLEKERHPKVIRWLAYTLAIAGGGKASLNALKNKLKNCSDSDVIQWIIASMQKIDLSLNENENFLYPDEFFSEYDFEVGIIKSWPFRKYTDESISILLKALENENKCIRKWAALSIGYKKINSTKIRNSLTACFDDDDFLVREWAMYALKDIATENDFHSIYNRLTKESHARVKEWAVKTLPYTYSREVSSVLINELQSHHFKNDTLYAEAVVSSLTLYIDRSDIQSKVIDILSNTKDDLILLAATKGIEQYIKIQKNEAIVCSLTQAYQHAQDDSVKRQIGMVLFGTLSYKEQQAISTILLNETKSHVLKTVLISNTDPIITKLLSSSGAHNENLANEDRSSQLKKNLPADYSEQSIEHSSNVFDDILSSISLENGRFKNQKQLIFIKENIMGDQFKTGQAGSVGHFSHAENMNFNQIWKEYNNESQIEELQHELSELRNVMRTRATDPEHDIAVSEIAKAEKAITEGNDSQIFAHLRAAGKWAFDVATDISTDIAAEIIKKSMWVCS